MNMVKKLERSRLLSVMLAAGLVGLAGCASAPAPSAAQMAAEGRITPQDLMIVNCLLPPQVRQLGESMNYLSPRRPVRTPARDCARRGGEYVAFDRANLASALRVWLPAAEGGEVDAMVHVGEIFEQGLGGVQPDYAAAAQWYRRAAEAGDSRAQINLGSLYERGMGVPRDNTQAMNWYRRAAGITDGTLEMSSAEELERRRLMEQESEDLRRQVVTLKQRLDQVQGELSQGQVELDRSRNDLATTRQQLAAAQSAGQPSQAMQQRLALLEADVQRREQEIASYRETTEELLAQLATPNDRQIAASGDAAITIISPQLTLTRSGVPAAPLLAQVATYQVIGRVQPAESLRSFRVNDQDQIASVDANGLFEFDVQVSQQQNPVLVEAVTADGRRITQNFLITRELDRALERRAVSNMFQRRLRSDLGNFHALVIGNNAYQQWTPLQTAVSDATEVARVLRQRYGFNVTLLENASQTQILAALSDLSQSLGESDNLVIYYAGHGQIDGDSGKGYWIPVNAGANPGPDWIPNEVVTDFIGAMSARHVLVVADSCYSGTLSGTAIRPIPMEASEQDLMFISRVKARTVLTSGGLQPIADEGSGGHSIFARAFLNALDSNENLLEGYRLFQEVQFNVSQRSQVTRLAQQPEYSALRHAGHEGSEFFFLPTSTTSALPPLRLAQR